MNSSYLPGALMVAGFTWVLTFCVLQLCATIYRNRNRSMDKKMDEDTKEKEDS